MPVFIPKPDEQANFWQPYLEPGEQVQAAWWFEQRLPLLIAMLLEQGGAIAELIFSAMRHRYFGALTDRRVLVMGSTGWHDPIPGKFEAFPRGAVTCTQFANWIGHVAMDLQVAGEPSVRRYRVPRSQRPQAELARALTGGGAMPQAAPFPPPVPPS
ncbi:MAG: hypothetical protein E6J29_04490 [Chloroflexi bacterium]|nr:MAG: hypothetical protein E6J29_04490 [Chloroflexota bacterium]TMD56490.1 MAG: hypothetical protein E6I85_00440 [Chloroflexota bacterium]